MFTIQLASLYTFVYSCACASLCGLQEVHGRCRSGSTHLLQLAQGRLGGVRAVLGVEVTQAVLLDGGAAHDALAADRLSSDRAGVGHWSKLRLADGGHPCIDGLREDDACASRGQGGEEARALNSTTTGGSRGSAFLKVDS